MLIYQTSNNYKIYQLLSGRCNVYFISGNNINIMIDTGKKHSCEKLIKTYHTFQLPSKCIDYLVLSHTHYDHCQNVNEIKEIYKCKILNSIHEANYTINGYTPLPKGTNILTKILIPIGSKIGKKQFGYKPFESDLLIESDFNIHKDIRIITTPGHSIGSISIIVDNEIALVGDTLFSIFKNSVFPPFADDIPQLIKSWDKLIQTNCKLFLPGHGKAITRDLLLAEYAKYKRKYGLN